MHLDKVFDNSLLNYDTSFSEVYDTVIAKNGFSEKRNAKIQNAYLQVHVDASNRLKTDASMLNDFYRECKGRLNTFNFKHPFNFSTSGVSDPTPLDVYIDEIENTSDDYPLNIQMKQRSGKKINIAKYGTVFVSFFDIDEENVYGKTCYIDDYENRYVALQQQYPDINFLDIENHQGTSFDYETGIATFSDSFIKPNYTTKIYIGCEFYYKVRFDTDNLTFSHNGFDSVSTDFYLIEVLK